MHDDDEVYQRRQVIAGKLQQELGLSFEFSVKTRFHYIDRHGMTDQMLADQQMWRVPFFVIAQLLNEQSEGWHVIDHAWWLLAADREDEPWGFVTEPYADVVKMRKLAAFISKHCEAWGVTARALPRAESAWYPGSCTPLAVFVRGGHLPAFLYHGVGEALHRLMGLPLV